MITGTDFQICTDWLILVLWEKWNTETFISGYTTLSLITLLEQHTPSVSSILIFSHCSWWWNSVELAQSQTWWRTQRTAWRKTGSPTFHERSSEWVDLTTPFSQFSPVTHALQTEWYKNTGYDPCKFVVNTRQWQNARKGILLCLKQDHLRCKRK